MAGMDGLSSYVDLVAVQPRISIDDYGSAEAYAGHHDELARRAKVVLDEAGPAPDGTIPPVLAVWPEMVGTFLAVQGRLSAVGDATTTDQALQRVGMRILPRLLVTMARHRTRSTTSAFLTATAPATWRTHVTTFSRIARSHGWWVVGGTFLVPRNANGDAATEFAPLGGPDGAKVYNTAITFDPHGRIRNVTRKVNLVPTQEDVLDLASGDPADLAVVDTDFGPLGTLVCYDGFGEAHTSGEPGWETCAPRLDRLGATVVAQPSANAWLWDAPWEFNDESVGENQLRREQWYAEGLYSQLSGFSAIRYAVNPQLVGDVLDNHFEAPSLILARTGDGPDSAPEILAEATTIDDEEVLHARVPVR
jgi:predicted amidohydrolase